MPVKHTFPLVATVERTVVDTISLRVEAISLDEAAEKAKQVVEKLPNAHEVDGVDYCYVENRVNKDAVTLSVELNIDAAGDNIA